ncbi:alpha/beta hydrolase [Eubacteriaceae bacterium ES2]|nr:alpha/beta hydrolase [Eubacteriaceae bacterium ES2]
MKKYPIHADFKKYQNMKTPISPLLLPTMNRVLENSYNKRLPASGVQEKTMMIPGYRDEMIEIRLYEPENIKADLPCLIYLHGGAFVLKSAAFHKDLICQYVLKTPCKVLFVDYRLAPKHICPTGLEDCYKALEWVYHHGSELGINKNKLAVGGDSAGGALAAGVCLMARDRKGPEILFQMLIYPVTDARLETDSMKEFLDTPLWNARQNKKMWQLYLGDKKNLELAYASPMEAKSFKDLPPAYLEVAEFDCLRDEGLLFAEALHNAGVSVQSIQTRGTIHGFEIAEDSIIVRESIDRRVKALQSIFSNTSI